MGFSVLIAEIDRTVNLMADGWSSSAYLGERAVATLRLRTGGRYGSFQAKIGHEVSAFDQWGVKVFGGHIYSIAERMATNSSELLQTCQLTDFHRICDRLYVTEVFPADMTCGDIVTALGKTVEYPAGSGALLSDDCVVLGVVSPGATTSGILIFGQEGPQSLSSVLDNLVELSGPGFSWWMDLAPTGAPRLNFASRDPGQAPQAPFGIADSGTFKFNTFERTLTDEKYANIVLLHFDRKLLDKVIEATDDSPATILPAPDGASQTFTVTKPISEEPAVFVNDVAVDIGLGPEADNPGHGWYWQLGSPDIKQNSGDPPLISGDVLRVEYFPLFADFTSELDQAEILRRAALSRDSGRVQIAVDRLELKDSAVITDTALQILAKVKMAGDRIQFTTDYPSEGAALNLGPGQIVTVGLAAHSLVNAPYWIDQVDMQLLTAKRKRVSDAVEKELLRFTVTAYGGAQLGNYIDFFKALARGGGGAGGGGGSLAYDSAVWHIGAAVQAGDNSTNYHHLRRDGAPVAAFATVKGALPTSDVVIDILSVDDTVAANRSIFDATKMVIPTGTRDSNAVVFNSPLPTFQKRKRLNLNVVSAGGCTRLQITVLYR